MPTAQSLPDQNRRVGLRLALCAALVLLTAAAFAPVVANGWVDYDDDVYVTANRMVLGGLSRAGIQWAFTTTHGGNWHPLTWLSHMLDCQVFGTAPLGPHLENVALHASVVVLIFWFLSAASPSRSTIWTAALAAAWFGLHPLRVEAVAWTSERKELLAALLFWIALLAYRGYARRSGATRIGWYCAGRDRLWAGTVGKTDSG